MITCMGRRTEAHSPSAAKEMDLFLYFSIFVKKPEIMDNFMLAFIVLLVSMFSARKIVAGAMAKLEQNKKAELMDLFSKKSSTNMAILIGIVIIFFANIKFRFIDQEIAYIVYSIALLSFLIISGLKSHKKLTEHGFPLDYIKSYITSTTIRFLGIIIFFIVLWKK